MPRIIYSLKFELLRVTDGEAMALIAPLDRHGQSPHCRALPPKKRVIDLRVLDHLWHGDMKYVVKGVEAYRDAYLDQVQGKRASDGYVVRGS